MANEEKELFKAKNASRIVEKIIFWILSTFLLLCAIVSFTTSGGMLSGVLFLVTAVFINPLMTGFVMNKGKKIPRWLLIIILIIGFLSGVLSYPVELQEKEDSSSISGDNLLIQGSVTEGNSVDAETIETELEYESKEEDAEHVDVTNEDDFKEACKEIIFTNINENTVGEYVTKELVFGKSSILEDGTTMYECGAVEDFIEGIEYQKIYNIYRVKDFRLQKDFPLAGSDIMRVYGVIEDVSKSYNTGYYNPTIKIYYAEYIRRYGEDQDTAKSAEEIKKEREEASKELEYKDTINSDYNGMTKNVSNMEELSLSEYMDCCDNMNLQDVVNSNEDLTGRYVKLHIQVSDHKKFTNDEGKTNRLGDWTEIEYVQDDVWYCKLYNERVDEYVYPKAKIDTLYFLNKNDIAASNLSKGDKLIVYGQLVKYDSTYGQFEMLVRYFEKE